MQDPEDRFDMGPHLIVQKMVPVVAVNTLVGRQIVLFSGFLKDIELGHLAEGAQQQHQRFRVQGSHPFGKPVLTALLHEFQQADQGLRAEIVLVPCIQIVPVQDLFRGHVRQERNGVGSADLFEGEVGLLHGQMRYQLFGVGREQEEFAPEFRGSQQEELHLFWKRQMGVFFQQVCGVLLQQGDPLADTAAGFGGGTGNGSRFRSVRAHGFPVSFGRRVAGRR